MWKLLVASLVSGSFFACGPLDESDLTATAESELLATEASALVQMREEEKLARDVYLALGAQWNLAIFANIAGSEQSHMDAVATLLTRYRVADPAAGKAPGEFTDPALQALYAQLVTKGALSASDALAVGALIEDLDLADLTRLSGETSRADILRVYDNLSRGSRNHLRSFVGQLGSYTPQYLDAASYDAIISGPAETGRR